MCTVQALSWMLRTVIFASERSTKRWVIVVLLLRKQEYGLMRLSGPVSHGFGVRIGLVPNGGVRAGFGVIAGRSAQSQRGSPRLMLRRLWRWAGCSHHGSEGLVAVTGNIERRIALLLKLFNSEFTMVPAFLCHRLSFTRMKLSDCVK